MEDHQVPISDKPACRLPWNKGKLVGAKPPLRPSHVWSIRTKLQMQGTSATSHCLTRRSTASFVAATWSPSVLTTWRRVDTRWIARRSDRGRPVGLSGSS